MKRKETAAVVSQDRIADGIFSLWLQVSFAKEAEAGQFVSLFTADGTRLLPRPVSICETDKDAGRIRLVYRIAGAGTEGFSKLKAGDRIDVMGPLGRGFPIDLALGKRVLLIGGGIGIPPMLSAATAIRLRDPDAAVTCAVGYRTNDRYLYNDLSAVSDVVVSTDDGSNGVHGTVMDAVRFSDADPQLIFACGPKVMLRAVKEYAKTKGVPCFISMEERMACGVGVCLGCICQTTGIDEHSHVKKARVCTDGPVFPAEEVDLT